MTAARPSRAARVRRRCARAPRAARRRRFPAGVGADPRAPEVSSVPYDLEARSIAFTTRGLGEVRPLGFQAREVFGRDVTGDVVAGETRRIEFLDARMIVLARGDQVVEILVDEPVGADELRH